MVCLGSAVRGPKFAFNGEVMGLWVVVDGSTWRDRVLMNENASGSRRVETGWVEKYP